MFVDFKFDYVRIDDPDDDFSDDMVEKKFEINNNGVMKPCTCPQQAYEDSDVDDDSDSGKFYNAFKRSSLCFTGTVVANWDETAVKLKCRKNHWEYENKQYTIEKSIENANRNAKKISNFSKFVCF